MQKLREGKEGLILPVKVIPNARENVIVGWQNGRLKIKVCAPPEKGEANRATVQLLSKVLQLSQHKIVLLRGANVREKDFLLMEYTQLEFDRLGFEER